MKRKPTFSRRRLIGGAGTSITALGAATLSTGLAGSLAAPAVRAESRFEWKMVTSWPVDAPGPGTTAARLARRITEGSGGRLTVKVFGAGELVPAFEVFDAVSSGTAELGHTASLFWAGKMAIAPIFTTAPFGLLPEGHNAWIAYGGGQALWDELYGPFGVKPYLAGNSGFQMAGWYRRKIEGLEDLKGLKIRAAGLGGEILRRLGAAPVVIPPGEIFTALKTGTIDAAEFLGPWSDTALGLNKAAPYYYWPGFDKPNGSAEALVNAKALAALPAELRSLVETACEAENARGLAEADWYNAQSLQGLEAGGTTLLRFPEPVLQAAKREAEGVMDTVAAKDPLYGRILESWRAARTASIAWGRVSRHALLDAQLAS
ncbi:TRAP-type mannitol/chloroaromatic compound transport system, substrate-binding protein [Tistlia consotensis]|uniref:TRAP-type mannitol/chloroaromatic compound transport system, substrate-binding protein n=1 Tax=Tistlia consotensis USBA 355 TaxID=560819 RepID=A0A1Y6B2M6_9PROT|nr:TRAP transporter substrate-binding protein [Tistlia consotensis]SME88264.1 TRAP-type mannitol/chloroaromatic compound transport system, substrate-binding protein [Tistlia consotensis USBA 355]SNR24716.1 TRAP-type mannitol/chloroaromatic compound transport system, substrate-binding protein [Tistlia consotensis]